MSYAFRLLLLLLLPLLFVLPLLLHGGRRLLGLLTAARAENNLDAGSRLGVADVDANSAAPEDEDDEASPLLLLLLLELLEPVVVTVEREDDEEELLATARLEPLLSPLTERTSLLLGQLAGVSAFFVLVRHVL